MATVSPARSGEADRTDRPANRQPAARRLVWSGDEPPIESATGNENDAQEVGESQACYICPVLMD
ncbi:hypothetical protein OROHE_018300 [Orobanche hederae]